MKGYGCFMEYTRLFYTLYILLQAIRFMPVLCIQHTPKHEKNKKKRLQSAKRPLTAKKKKADMVTGDLDKMVQTMSAQQKADAATRKREKMYPKAKGLVKA